MDGEYNFDTFTLGKVYSSGMREAVGLCTNKMYLLLSFELLAFVRKYS